MDEQQAREDLKRQLPSYVASVTTKSRYGKYVCPFCKSGQGKSGTGAFSIKDGVSWKCFSCNAGGDIFDLYGELNGVKDHKQQLEDVGAMYGISIDNGGNHTTAYQKQDKTEHTHNCIHTTVYTQPPAPQEESFQDFYLQAHNAIDQTDYWKQRGLSKETVDRFNLGYVENWRHPNAPKAPTSPRLIIPITEHSYLARDTRSEVPEGQEGYKKSKVKGAEKVSWTFNSEALQNGQKPVFVVEGELDALSIIDVGGEAVALGSINFVRAFLELVSHKKPATPLVIALDNEEKENVQKARRELTAGLERLQIPFFDFNPAGECKDANEALQRDREALRSAVAEAEHIANAEEREKRENYLKSSTAFHLADFWDGIHKNADTPFIPTGFPVLDKILDGGLYEGLYIVGAISSLGKTTLVTQIVDQIAQGGKDVLLFSLEMARSELMSKSISRHTLKACLEKNLPLSNAKTSRGITTSSRWANYSEQEKKLISEAVVAYSQYAEHLYIVEGEGEVGIAQILETVELHEKYTGNTPVVVVDYLQILAPHNERTSDKQNTDKAVLELKRLSRKKKTPVIAISSFNRENYKTEVNMGAFKESGAIEYGSDILIGLQLEGAGSPGFNAEEAKKNNPREVELVILKNRNGQTGDTINYNYYPMFNYYQELEE